MYSSLQLSSSAIEGMLPLLIVKDDTKSPLKVSLVPSRPSQDPNGDWLAPIPTLQSSDFQQRGALPLVFINSLEWSRTEVVDILLPAASFGDIINEKGEAQPWQATEVSRLTEWIKVPDGVQPKELLRVSFFVTVPPLGFTTYFIFPPSDINGNNHHPQQHKKGGHKASRFVEPSTWKYDMQLSLENEHVKAIFHEKTARLYMMKDKKTGLDMKVKQHFRFYRSEDNGVIASGAYIFRTTLWYVW